MRKYGDPLPEVTLPSGRIVRGVIVRVRNPEKQAVLRHPTNPEILARLACNKSIRRYLGRGKTITDPLPTRKAGRVLFERLRLDNGPPFDEFEAKTAMETLLKCDPVTSKQTDDGYTVILRTLFGDVGHVFRFPTQREFDSYRRNVLTVRQLGGNMEEVRAHCAPAAELYIACIVSVIGYADHIGPEEMPPHHISEAVATFADFLV